MFCTGGRMIGGQLGAPLTQSPHFSRKERARNGAPFLNLHLDYFELFLAARRPGGSWPFSGRSRSMASDMVWRGLSPREDKTAPWDETVRPCAVNMASL